MEKKLFLKYLDSTKALGHLLIASLALLSSKGININFLFEDGIRNCFSHDFNLKIYDQGTLSKLPITWKNIRITKEMLGRPIKSSEINQRHFAELLKVMIMNELFVIEYILKNHEIRKSIEPSKSLLSRNKFDKSSIICFKHSSSVSLKYTRKDILVVLLLFPFI